MVCTAVASIACSAPSPHPTVVVLETSWDAVLDVPDGYASLSLPVKAASPERRHGRRLRGDMGSLQSGGRSSLRRSIGDRVLGIREIDHAPAFLASFFDENFASRLSAGFLGAAPSSNSPPFASRYGLKT